VFRYLEAITNNNSTATTINCPVEIDVYNTEGELVAALTNNEPMFTVNEHGVFFVYQHEGTDDYVKVVKVNSNDYTLVIRGVGTGTMNYSIEQMQADGSIIRLSAQDIPIDDTTVINAGTDINSNTLQIEDESGEDSFITMTLTVIKAPNYGDVDGDGYITSVDVSLIRMYLAATDKEVFLARFPWFIVENADANGDGIIDDKDVILLRRYIAAGANNKPTLGPQ
jgi:hypothetical protein